MPERRKSSPASNERADPYAYPSGFHRARRRRPRRHHRRRATRRRPDGPARAARGVSGPQQRAGPDGALLPQGQGWPRRPRERRQHRRRYRGDRRLRRRGVDRGDQAHARRQERARKRPDHRGRARRARRRAHGTQRTQRPRLGRLHADGAHGGRDRDPFDIGHAESDERAGAGPRGNHQRRRHHVGIAARRGGQIGVGQRRADGRRGGRGDDGERAA